MSKEDLDFGEPWDLIFYTRFVDDVYGPVEWCVESLDGRVLSQRTGSHSEAFDWDALKRAVDCVNVCAGWDIEEVREALAEKEAKWAKEKEKNEF